MKRIIFASLVLLLNLDLGLMAEADDYGGGNPPAPAIGIGARAQPDLIVRVAGPRRANPGDEIGEQIRQEAMNRGEASAPGTLGRIDPHNGYMIDLLLSTDEDAPEVPARISRDFREDMLLQGGRTSRTDDLFSGDRRNYPVGARIPRNTPSGSYFICARIDSYGRVAEANERNNISCFPIYIGEPPPAVGVGGDRGNGVPHYHRGGITIERINPEASSPGRTIHIYGRNFGSFQGERVVGINRGRVNRMEVLDWSDGRIRARVPDSLAPGNYRVLIYYDDSFRTSSNSLVVTVEGQQR